MKRRQSMYDNIYNKTLQISLPISGGSRISRRGGVHPLGGVDLQRGHFLVKMYAKMKELGPIGGRAPGMPPLDLPMPIFESCTMTTTSNIPYTVYASALVLVQMSFQMFCPHRQPTSNVFIY